MPAMKTKTNIIPVPDFAAKMREIRTSLELTRPEFATRLNISKHAVAAYEQRLRRVPADVWERTLFLQRSADKAAAVRRFLAGQMADDPSFWEEVYDKYDETGKL